MEVNNFVTELERIYHTNGRHIHTVREKGYQIQDLVKRYLLTGKQTHLYVAHEHLKTMNKKLNSKYSLKHIDEIAGEVELINNIEAFDNPY